MKMPDFKKQNEIISNWVRQIRITHSNVKDNNDEPLGMKFSKNYLKEKNLWNEEITKKGIYCHSLDSVCLRIGKSDGKGILSRLYSHYLAAYGYDSEKRYNLFFNKYIDAEITISYMAIDNIEMISEFESYLQWQYLPIFDLLPKIPILEHYTDDFIKYAEEMQKKIAKKQLKNI